MITEVTGSAPVLLLDDVFSELDPDRSDALLANLPAGQTLLTSASGLPPKAEPDLVLEVARRPHRRVEREPSTRATVRPSVRGTAADDGPMPAPTAAR